MKSLSVKLLAAAALLVTGLTVSANDGQCDCNQGSGNYVGYQACNWNSCDPCHNHCGHGGRCRADRRWMAGEGWTRPMFADTALGRCCATKAYPDRGWAPPAHFPMNYDWAWYASYHPQACYGTPGGGFVANYPVVYQPTDTTQLGYYYHNVPTWQSRPDLIPPAPCPSNFHSRICLPWHGCHGGAACDSGCETCNHSVEVVGPQYCSPNGRVVRHAGPRRGGLLGGFRLTSMFE